MANVTNSLGEEPRRWSGRWVLVCSLLVLALFIGTQVLVTIVMMVVQAAAQPDFNVAEWSQHAGSNGLLLSLATFATAAVCVPFVRFLVGRREQAPWSFLALRRVGARSIAMWLLAMAGFLLASDILTLTIGRPLVPDFMVEAYASAGQPAVLLGALVVAAPLFEEIFFRGFLLSALTAARIPVSASVILTSLVWAAIHVQYDLYELATIFVMGLLLSAARLRTNSILPCLAMHAFTNAAAFSETALLAGSAAV